MEKTHEKALSVKTREIRAFLGKISQKKLAKLMGVAEKTVQNYEEGKNDDSDDPRRHEFEKKLNELRRKHEAENAQLERMQFAQEGEIEKRITHLEEQVSELNKAVVRLNNLLRSSRSGTSS